MSTIAKLPSGAVVRRAAHLLLASALLSAVAYGRPGQDQGAKTPGTSRKEKIVEYIARAKQDTPISGVVVEQLAEAGAVEAIPVLEDKFARIPGGPREYPTEDAFLKAHVASALIRLGDKKEIYWDYLLKQAALVIDSDAPDPSSIDSNGKYAESPEFIAWIKAHNLAHPGVAAEYTYIFPQPVAFLAMTGDPRAVPLLRRGLLSPNFLVESSSADGLVQAGDKSSIPLIIEACKKAPPDVAVVIARSLVYFDDPEAQKAVDQYVPRYLASAYREDKARGKEKPFSPRFMNTLIPLK
jgi:hypothetical protein